MYKIFIKIIIIVFILLFVFDSCDFSNLQDPLEKKKIHLSL